MSKPATTEKPAVRSSNLLARWQEDIDRMERMFDGFRPSRLPRLFDWSATGLQTVTAPAVDVFEDADDIVVKAEIPGAKKDEIEVNVTDSTLTISGQKERKEEVNEDRYYRCERSYGAFSRSVELPSEVQAGKAKASFTDGVLEVRLPKTDEARKKAVKLKIT
jgi:HSP20 family protein